MRRLLAVMLVLAATPAVAKRPAPPGFAEPGDIIAAEGNFTHVSAAKGIKAAIRATAAADAQIFAPQLMRVADYANRADLSEAPWHTSQVWMSCDGSVAVTHGTWQQPPAIGWYITIWKRQKGGGYKWVLEEGGPLAAAPADSDMISASVADCPVRRARGTANAPAAPEHGKAPLADYTSGHADDGTLVWATIAAAAGSRSFVLQIKQDGVLHEVLRATAAPPGA
jgi:hypothetical protein